MNIKGKVERTKQYIIKQSTPIFNSKRIAGNAEETNSKAPTLMTLLEQYIAGWRTHDTNAILSTLTLDCGVTESFGPVYRGHAWVKRWIAAWFAENGRVIDWTIHDLQSLRDVETAEWTFHYTWRGEEKSFDGTTIARLHEGKISYLREYATTAPLYDWQGEWPPL